VEKFGVPRDEMLNGKAEAGAPLVDMFSMFKDQV
jgi:hypothetical protein